MGEMTRLDPYTELRTLIDWPRWPFEALRREFGGAFGTLPVDVFEENENLVVKTEIPGMKKEDIHIDVTEGVLQINAETKEEKEIEEKDYFLHEVRRGKFARALRLPGNINVAKAVAEYKDGVLKIWMPKLEGAKTRTVQVQVG